MRKVLESLGIAALLLLVWITCRGVYGPASLPQTIPTHFGIDGRPNAWGPLASLWVLPGICVAIYLFISLVALFPESFNYPVRVKPGNRLRVQTLALQMISWIKFELAGLFLYIQWFTIESMREAKPALGSLVMPLCIAGIFATVAIFAVAIVREGGRTASPRIKR